MRSLLFLFIFSSCATRQIPDVAHNSVEIYRGMAKSQVLASLGKPTRVDNESLTHETWIYEDISRQLTYSNTTDSKWYLHKSEEKLNLCIQYGKDHTVEAITSQRKWSQKSE